MAISLAICTPEQLIAEEKSDKVILPIDVGNLTVIDGRAPSSLMLSGGVIATLNAENKMLKRWFISGGFADIAENKCKVAAERAVDLQKISMAEAETLAATSAFYQKIYEYLKIFG